MRGPGPKCCQVLPGMCIQDSPRSLCAPPAASEASSKPHPRKAQARPSLPFLFSALMCVRLKMVRNFFFSSKLGLLFISSGL